MRSGRFVTIQAFVCGHVLQRPALFHARRGFLHFFIFCRRPGHPPILHILHGRKYERQAEKRCRRRDFPFWALEFREELRRMPCVPGAGGNGKLRSVADVGSVISLSLGATRVLDELQRMLL